MDLNGYGVVFLQFISYQACLKLQRSGWSNYHTVFNIISLVHTYRDIPLLTLQHKTHMQIWPDFPSSARFWLARLVLDHIEHKSFISKWIYQQPSLYSSMWDYTHWVPRMPGSLFSRQCEHREFELCTVFTPCSIIFLLLLVHAWQNPLPFCILFISSKHGN